MKRTIRALVLVWVFVGSGLAFAADPGGNTLYTRIVDTGAGLCTITRMPGPHFFIYDTGHWNGSSLCSAAVKRIVPSGAKIDMFIQSHSDGDHIGATEEILAFYDVNTLIRTGDWRFDTVSYQEAFNAIRTKRNAGGIREDVNLFNGHVLPGQTFPYGTSEVVLISGFNDPPEDWGIKWWNKSKSNNSISIVAQLNFAGESILFSGDAVGREDDGSKDCWATEKYMVDNAVAVPIKSSVLIAPHHGANNASSDCFIDEVDPEYVIFAAGHGHEHPRAAVAQRYLTHGVDINKMLRTDKGDAEGPKEWSHGTTGVDDPRGDDDIEIIIDANGEITVRYD